MQCTIFTCDLFSPEYITNIRALYSQISAGDPASGAANDHKSTRKHVTLIVSLRLSRRLRDVSARNGEKIVLNIYRVEQIVSTTDLGNRPQECISIDVKKRHGTSPIARSRFKRIAVVDSMLTAKERRRRSRSDSVASAASSLASLSDKENDRRGMDDKGKAPAHGPSAARKRKFGVQGGDSQPTENGTSTAVAAKTKILGLDFYDPDQDMGERRQIRKDYRDLSRELSGKFYMVISALQYDSSHVPDELGHVAQ